MAEMIWHHLGGFSKLLPEFITSARSRLTDERDRSAWTSSESQYQEGLTWGFPNGYGASLVCNSLTNNKPEFAVLEDNQICCNTNITSDVIPYVTVSEVALLLARVRGLRKVDFP